MGEGSSVAVRVGVVVGKISGAEGEFEAEKTIGEAGSVSNVGRSTEDFIWGVGYRLHRAAREQK